ncbi:MAG: hypothetical protein ABI867_06785 [Kofleriaceae bacterium]
MRRRSTWGGARPGAGRPASGSRSSEPHKRRPELVRGRPIHVSARVVRGVGDLRARRTRAAIDGAVARSRARHDFAILALAVSRTRIELEIAADDRTALARGMQGFQVAAARALNRATARTGTVFPDRYRIAD